MTNTNENPNPPLADAAGSLTLSIRLERDDRIPAWAAFLDCQPPGASNHVILMNVGAVMAPAVEYEDGSPAPQSRADRTRILITSLMHEFGHALEKQLHQPHQEEAIEAACEAWESIYTANTKRSEPTTTDI
jgi:hypothetical protein